MRRHRRLALLPILLVALTGAAARPASGRQRGPDIHFAPTPQPVADRMLALAEVDATDTVFDLGSGDGRLVVLAAQRYGARGVGVELQPWLVDLSRTVARESGVAERVTFIQGDLFEADISAATVVMIWLSDSVNARLAPKLRRELRPGTRIVSHQFPIEGWAPDAVVHLDDYRTDLFLFVVPPR